MNPNFLDRLLRRGKGGLVSLPRGAGGTWQHIPRAQRRQRLGQGRPVSFRSRLLLAEHPLRSAAFSAAT
jgi:hypothetical protein